MVSMYFDPSSLLVQLRLGRQSDFEDTVKEVSAKLSLVPLPPPGQLHVVSRHGYTSFSVSPPVSPPVCPSLPQPSFF